MTPLRLPLNGGLFPILHWLSWFRAIVAAVLTWLVAGSASAATLALTLCGVLLLAVGLPSSALAQLSYVTNGAAITITGYDTAAGPAVVIPDRIGGYPVTRIRENAFRSSSITQVIIGDAVTQIGTSAFYSCTNLMSITIGSAVNGIGDSAFSRCMRLTTVTIPDSVTSLGASAFVSCSGLTNVTLGNAVTGVGDFAFSRCTKLTAVTIPNSVISLGTSAFWGCSGLTNVALGNAVTRIDDFAFNNCAKLTSFSLPASVVSLGTDIFYGCTTLTNIGVDSDNPAYSSVDGVLLDRSQSALILYPVGKAGSYALPDSVASIGLRAFQGCLNLTGVSMGGSVTNIGDWAFDSCVNLASVTIGKGVASIGYSAFSQCSSLMSVAIPAGVTNLGRSVFANCSSLTAVTIPNGLPLIASEAFAGCWNLLNVTLPDGVTRIESEAFSLCTSLTNLVIPDSVTNIGDAAFSGCSSLAAVTLGSGVNQMGLGVFNGCTSLTNIAVAAANPRFSSVDGVVLDKGQTTLLLCPAGKAGSYTIPDSVIRIEVEAFLGCAVLTSVRLGSGVTHIGSEAFVGCSTLASFVVPSNNPAYSSLDGVLFDRSQSTLILCPWGKASYSIPDGVTHIGEIAFFGCPNLTRVSIPGSVTQVGDFAFDSCPSLSSVFFGGDCPAFVGSLFDGSPAILYYLPGTSGWSDTVADRPALLWNPAVQTGASGFGVQPGGFGLPITGTIDIPIVLEAASDLAGGWIPLVSCTLTNGNIQYLDANSTNHPERYYRIRPPGVTLTTLVSDSRLKHDIHLLVTMVDGMRLYSFKYLWSDTDYVGVMAQDLLTQPAWRDAVVTRPDGFYAVNYAKLGLRMTTLADWSARGLPAVEPSQ